jgi:type II secretory pathway pseudopilin PulG
MSARQRISVVAGFSLVEVTIAIGLFAFVLVGILGLYPAALRQRSDAAVELRATLIAQQVFGGIRGANSVSNAVASDYSIKWTEPKNPSLRDYVNGVVLGFSQDGTTVNHIFDNTNSWASADVGPVAQNITTKALVTASNVSPGLYAVTLQVGYPANLPADKRRTQSFQASVYAQ